MMKMEKTKVNVRDMAMTALMAAVLAVLSPWSIPIGPVPVSLGLFGVYLAAHLAACAIGSGIFAWLCARKHALAQLQAKD